MVSCLCSTSLIGSGRLWQPVGARASSPVTNVHLAGVGSEKFGEGQTATVQDAVGRWSASCVVCSVFRANFLALWWPRLTTTIERARDDSPLVEVLWSAGDQNPPSAFHLIPFRAGNWHNTTANRILSASERSIREEM